MVSCAQKSSFGTGFRAGLHRRFFMHYHMCCACWLSDVLLFHVSFKFACTIVLLVSIVCVCVCGIVLAAFVFLCVTATTIATTTTTTTSATSVSA